MRAVIDAATIGPAVGATERRRRREVGGLDDAGPVEGGLGRDALGVDGRGDGVVVPGGGRGIAPLAGGGRLERGELALPGGHHLGVGEGVTGHALGGLAAVAHLHAVAGFCHHTRAALHLESPVTVFHG